MVCRGVQGRRGVADDNDGLRCRDHAVRHRSGAPPGILWPAGYQPRSSGVNHGIIFSFRCYRHVVFHCAPKPQRTASCSLLSVQRLCRGRACPNMPHSSIYASSNVSHIKLNQHDDSSKTPPSPHNHSNHSPDSRSMRCSLRPATVHTCVPPFPPLGEHLNTVARGHKRSRGAHPKDLRHKKQH